MNKKSIFTIAFILILIFSFDFLFAQIGKKEYIYSYSDSLLWTKSTKFDEPIYPKSNDKKRILIIGDSFMSSLGGDSSIDDLYAKKLKQILNQYSKDYEIINKGIPGFGTDQELLYLIEKGLTFSPDIVILGFYLENDPADNSKNLFLLRNSKIEKNKEFNWYIRKMKLRFLLYLSYNSLLYRTFRSFNMDIISLAKKSGLFPYDPLYGWRIFSKKEDADLIENNFLKTQLLLEEMKQICDKRNITFIVLMIPSTLEISSENLFDIDRRQLNFDKINNKMLNFFSDNNFNVIDLKPEFLKQKDDIQLYIKEDIHWSKKGRELAANITANYLLNKAT